MVFVTENKHKVYAEEFQNIDFEKSLSLCNSLFSAKTEAC